MKNAFGLLLAALIAVPGVLRAQGGTFVIEGRAASAALLKARLFYRDWGEIVTGIFA